MRPQLNHKSLGIVESNKFLSTPIHLRYKQVLSERERRLQALQRMVRIEQAQKYPEDLFPSFRPDLVQSQEIVSGRPLSPDKR